MLAYRITTPEGSVIYDNDEGGEGGAGRRMSELLQMMNATNVVVLVTRWYGGIQLGPDRFWDISNAAREIGRASWRERVCQYVEVAVVAVSLTYNDQHTTNESTEGKNL